MIGFIVSSGVRLSFGLIDSGFCFKDTTGPRFNSRSFRTHRAPLSTSCMKSDSISTSNRIPNETHVFYNKASSKALENARDSLQLHTNSTRQQLIHLLLSHSSQSNVNIEQFNTEVLSTIQALESLSQRPLTESFADMALRGNWNLVFSNARKRVLTTEEANENNALDLSRVLQIIDFSSMKLANIIVFEEVKAKGQLIVSNSITKSEDIAASRSVIHLNEHQLIPHSKNIASPEELGDVVTKIQRHIPPEFFDPDNSIQDTTYVDTHVKIVRFMDQKYSGLVHVYVRNVPLISPPSNSSDSEAVEQEQSSKSNGKPNGRSELISE